MIFAVESALMQGSDKMNTLLPNAVASSLLLYLHSRMKG